MSKNQKRKAEKGRAAARRSLAAFTLATCEGHEPKYKLARPHWILADALQRVREGTCKRLIVSMPPQHGKTQLAGICFPAWCYAQLDEDGKPWDIDIIAASYGKERAEDVGKDLRGLIKSDQYQWLFPEVKIRSESDAAKRFNLSTGASYWSAGIEGSVTGKGCGILLIDDPTKDAKQADSPTYRRQFKTWWLGTIRTRLRAGGAIVLTVTRWHEDDLPGWLIREGIGTWEVINLQAVNEETGEMLWPESGRDHAWMAETKKEVKMRAWEAQFMGRPTPPKGIIFDRDWWKYYTPAERPPTFDCVILAHDPNLGQEIRDGDSTKRSFAVWQVWGRIGPDFYLLDQRRSQEGLSWSYKAADDLLALWPQIRGIYIEETVAGPGTMLQLKKKYPGVIGIKAVGSKEKRAEVMEPYARAGNIYLPRNIVVDAYGDSEAVWVQEFVEEYAAFPRGGADDQVDCGSHAIAQLSQRKHVPAAAPVSIEQANEWAM